MGSESVSNEPGERNKHQYLKWMSLNIVFFLFGSLVLFWTLYQLSISSQPLIDYFLALMFLVFFAYLIVDNLNRITIKNGIRVAINAIEKECLEKPANNDPSRMMIASINDLSLQLSKYVNKPIGIVPITQYYESQLKRRIDLVFSCIAEAMYYDCYTRRNAEPVPKQEEKCHLDYVELATWVRALSNHLVGKRRAFRPSSVELSTLKYFLDDKIATFKEGINQPLYKEYQASVEAFHNGIEQKAASRRTSFIQFSLAIVLAVTTGVIGYLLKGI